MIYDMSTIVSYMKPNPLYTYIIYIYVYMICFGWVLGHINHCLLFDAKSSLYPYIIKPNQSKSIIYNIYV